MIISSKTNSEDEVGSNENYSNLNDIENYNQLFNNDSSFHFITNNLDIVLNYEVTR